MDQQIRFQMPEASWPTLKKIIRAYHAKRSSENVQVLDVAQAAGLHRPLVSSNNNFLKSVGLLEHDAYRLTPLGTELGVGISRNDADTVREALRKIVEGCAPLNGLVETLEARGELSVEAFESQVLLALDLSENDRRVRWIGTLLDLLSEADRIVVEGGMVRPLATERRSTRSTPIPLLQTSPSETTQNKLTTGFRRIPIPVSAGSVWYVEIAESQKPEELKKFLSMQRLIFDVKDEKN